MAGITKAHITTEACEFMIGKLENYSNCLVASDKKMNDALEKLSESHRDQNFVRFDDAFTPLWEDIQKFKEAVDHFREHMESLKKQILETGEITLNL